MDYCEEHPEAKDSVSPGGAAAVMDCSRQFVYSLVRRGKLRAWTIYDADAGPAGYQGPGKTSPNEQASYIYISHADCIRHAQQPKNKGGRPKKVA
jgi:hypothetical protein